MRKLTNSTIVVALVMALLTSGLLVGCQTEGETTQGSGNLITKELDFNDYNRLKVEPSFGVDIVQSDSYSINITADDNLIEYVQVTQVGETLNIGLKSCDCSFTSLIAEITMPDLYQLDFSSSIHGVVRGFHLSHDLVIHLSASSFLEIIDMSVGDITLDLSASSRVSGEITADNSILDISSSSSVELEGSANDLVIDAAGSSYIQLRNFPVKDADVTLRGSCHATVNLYGILDADVSGSSHLKYIGEPTVGDIYVSDSSTLEPE